MNQPVVDRAEFFDTLISVQNYISTLNNQSSLN